MKPLYRKITHSDLYSFSAFIERPPEFDTPWHNHPEYELILILGSRGTRFMGDSIADFKETELILIGPNLPHFWKEDSRNINKSAEAFVLHFSADFLGMNFFNLPETKKIKQLLDKAQLGLKFQVDSESSLVKTIKSLHEKKDFDKMLALLQLLNNMATYKRFEQLSSPGFANFITEQKSNRINKIFEYSITNFKEAIKLDAVAGMINMSKPSFCRFFKKSTGKAYFDFIKELRIGYACKLLQESNMSVIQICFECGYESISNFNRQFKEIINETPFKYRQSFIEQVS